MVFKRYIKKNGKKLGPYYYENVRHEGRVRTVYVGTNPQHHPKHKIRKPLFFFILVLVLILILGSALFFLQNKSYLINKVVAQQPNFDVDQILLKVLVRSGEFIEKELRVMNTGSEPSVFSLESSGLPDLVRLDSNSFRLKPGQTKIITLNFSSVIPQEKIEQEPGIYIGKLIIRSEKSAREIPIVVEIETKNVLFDMNLNPVAIERKVRQGSDTTIEVRLFNLESIDSVNVDVEYFVKDVNSNTIVTESETVVVKTQASFFKTVSIPKNLKPGPYIFAGKTKFGKSVGTSSYLFEVIGPETPGFVQFCKNNLLCLGLSLTTMLLLFALMAYFYFFIGAYLFEKVTGIETLQKKKKEEVQEAIERERPAIFARAKDIFFGWINKRKEKSIEKEKARKEKELQKQQKNARKLQEKEELKKQKEDARKRKELEKEKEREFRKRLIVGVLHSIGLYKTPEERRQIALLREKERQERLKRLEAEKKKIESKPSRNLKEFKNILEEAKIAVIKKDVSEVYNLYSKANDLYINLPQHEKQAVYNELMVLYKQRNDLVKERNTEEEIRKQKELEKQQEDEAKRKNLEKEKLKRERKDRVISFLHNIGLYKTPEERKQIALQKEKERQAKLKREEQERKLKELERKKKEEELKKQKEVEEKRKLEEIKQKQAEEQRRQQEERKAELKPSRNLYEFKKILEEAKKATYKKEAAIVDKLYFKANDLYISLPHHEKQAIYNDLMTLYRQRNELVKEKGIKEDIKKQKETERKKEEERKKIELEREKSAKERRKKFKAFLYDIGLYKTPEERRQIALLREKERQERLKQLEQERKLRELEARRREEEKKKEIELQRKLEVERLRKEAFERRRVEIERRKAEAQRKKQEEIDRKQNELKEKRMRQEELRKRVEFRKQKELERKREEEERKKLVEEARRQKEAERKRKEEERIREKEESEKTKPKLGILRKLFKAEKPIKDIKEEKKETKKEEKIEKSNLDKCYDDLHKAKEFIKTKNMKKGKAFYISARNIYVKLDYEDKKKVYNELMEVYNKLLK